MGAACSREEDVIHPNSTTPALPAQLQRTPSTQPSAGLYPVYEATAEKTGDGLVDLPAFLGGSWRHRIFRLRNHMITYHKEWRGPEMGFFHLQNSLFHSQGNEIYIGLPRTDATTQPELDAVHRWHHLRFGTAGEAAKLAQEIRRSFQVDGRVRSPSPDIPIDSEKFIPAGAPRWLVNHPAMLHNTNSSRGPLQVPYDDSPAVMLFDFGPGPACLSQFRLHTEDDESCPRSVSFQMSDRTGRWAKWIHVAEVELPRLQGWQEPKGFPPHVARYWRLVVHSTHAAMRSTGARIQQVAFFGSVCEECAAQCAAQGCAEALAGTGFTGHVPTMGEPEGGCGGEGSQGGPADLEGEPRPRMGSRASPGSAAPAISEAAVFFDKYFDKSGSGAVDRGTFIAGLQEALQDPYLLRAAGELGNGGAQNPFHEEGGMDQPAEVPPTERGNQVRASCAISHHLRAAAHAELTRLLALAADKAPPGSPLVLVQASVGTARLLDAAVDESHRSSMPPELNLDPVDVSYDSHFTGRVLHEGHA